MRNPRNRRRRSQLGKRLFAGLRNRPQRRSPSSRKPIDKRDLKLEALEMRQLLAVGPQLSAVWSNVTDPDNVTEVGDILFLETLRTGDLDQRTLNAVPQQLTFVFNEGPPIDETTIESGIRITRSGFDDTFGNANDKLVFPGHALDPTATFPGYFGVDPDHPNRVIIRFPEALPDDLYKVEITGLGAGALADTAGDTFGLNDVNTDFEFELNLELGAQVVSVVPQPMVRQSNGDLTQLRREIHVYFNDDDLIEESAENEAFYQLIFTNDTVSNLDDEVFNPIQVTYDADADRAILRFADDLDELTHTPGFRTSGTYRLRIGTDEALAEAPVHVDLRTDVSTDMNTDGEVVIKFTSNVHVGAGNPIELVFEKEASGVLDPAPVIDVTDRTITVTLNETPGYETRALDLVPAINSDPASRELVFAELSGGNPPVDVTTNTPAGFTLSIVDPGSAFVTAYNLDDMPGVDLDAEPIVISSEIESQYYGIELPGSNDDLAHSLSAHVFRRADQDPGVISVPYNFRNPFGEIPRDTDGNGTIDVWVTAFNLISEVQKERVREAFDFWSENLGIQFFETVEDGITVAKGDLKVLLGISGDDQDEAGNLLSMAGVVDDPVFGLVSTALMDDGEPWDDSFGQTDRPSQTPSFFLEAVQQIGVLLGMSLNGVEFPPIQVMQEYPIIPDITEFGQPPLLNEIGPDLPDDPREHRVEPIFPGDHDILHGQYLYRPESKDIDLYQFSVDREGLLTLETMAERLPDSSLLDTVLTLYQEDSKGGFEIIARNDDYYSEDSFIELYVDEGDYIVAVSSTGNTDFDPVIEDTGYGGTTEGQYDLRLNFRPQVLPENIIMDTGFSALDGDYDGTEQGVYNFWGRAEGDVRSIFVRGGAEVFEDGQEFRITDTRGSTITFEFDNNFKVGPSRFPIRYTDTDDLNAMVSKIASAIQSHPLLRITTAIQGNEIILGGERSLTVQPDFGAIGLRGKTIYVDKIADGGDPTYVPDGTINAPFTTINAAFTNANLGAQFGDIVRIVGNGGADGDLWTRDDNVTYEIGFDDSQATPRPLRDGTTMNVPAGVTVQVDPGAIFKLREASVTTGSDDAGSIPRNASSLQVFGTPRIIQGNGSVRLDAAGNILPGTVLFTSYRDSLIGVDTNPLVDATFPDPGDWGGLVFRNDHDHSGGLFTWDSEGIFMNYVNHADVRYGGGLVKSTSVPEIHNPIHMTEARPTLTFNVITESNDSAMSADPDSFQEDNFHAPKYQFSRDIQAAIVNQFEQDYLDPSQFFLHWEHFTSDYSRIGPEIHGNRLLDYRDDDNNDTLEPHSNSFNSLFVRTRTQPGEPLEEQTVTGRWNDTDIVHSVSENLLLQGTPGGPDAIPVFVSGGAGLTEPGVEEIVDPLDFIDLAVARRPEYLLSAREDASLKIDPGMVVKLTSSHIESTFSSQLIAEGRPGQKVIFTSGSDDRYGSGGLFDTANDGDEPPEPGDWGGLSFQTLSRGSIDEALIAFGGGPTRIEGEFASFNAVEITQAKVRLANTLFHNNDDGWGDNGISSRIGRGFNEPATIFVRGAQPIILQNTFQNNTGPVISINANALNSNLVDDEGRSSGVIFITDAESRATRGPDNQGPLIVGNKLGQYNEDITDPFGIDPLTGEQLPANRDQLNGMDIRAETLTTETVWDDVDIVHVVREEIVIPNFHTFGGLRLESSGEGSLVVKLGEKDQVDSLTRLPFTSMGGITVGGEQGAIHDRVGGRLIVAGQGAHPVILTSLYDDSVAVGEDPDGSPVRDTNSDGDSRTDPNAQAPAAGDWRSIKIEEFSHDRNVATYTEQESPEEDPPTPAIPTGNSVPAQAEYLGLLAQDEKGGDDNLRLGFEVHGLLNQPSDLDIYSFEAVTGTEIWIDVDRTSQDLDLVVELIDLNQTVLARSDNSIAEDEDYDDSLAGNAEAELLLDNPLAPGQQVNPLRKSFFEVPDRYGVNQFDPGMRIVLGGAPGETNVYHVRVRSSNRVLVSEGGNHDLDSDIYGGLTEGAYQMQIRLNEHDDIPGSAVWFADIRYATNGIEVYGQPTHSPLGGEANESPAFNNDFANAQYIGSLSNSDRYAISVNGSLEREADPAFPDDFDVGVAFTPYAEWDVDWYRAELGGSIIIEQDWTDGYGRPDTTLFLFDQDGRLIAQSDGSQVQEDAPAPLQNADLTDLLHGSASVDDPFLGPIDLEPGDYYIAVAGPYRVPTELNRVGVKTVPVESSGRIVEEHFVEPPPIPVPGAWFPQPPSWLTIGNSPSVLDPTLGVTSYEMPQIGQLDPITFLPADFLDAESVVPYHLGDVVMFVSGEGDQIHESRIYTVNPFTGVWETYIGEFDYEVNDIVMRYADGELHAITDGTEYIPEGPTDANSGQYIIIDSGTAAAILDSNGDGTNDLLDDGIETYQVNPDDPTTSIKTRPGETGDGIQFNALEYVVSPNDVEHLLGVGDRARPDSLGIDYGRNILYDLDPETGLAFSNPFDDRDDGDADGEAIYFGAGTQIRELGELLTSPRLDFIDYSDIDDDEDPANNIPPEGLDVTMQEPNGTTVFALTDGLTVNVQDGNDVSTFELDTGPDVFQDIDLRNNPRETIRDGQFFTLDPDSTIDGDEVTFQLDTGPVIGVGGGVRAGQNIADGLTFSIQPQGGFGLDLKTVTFEINDPNLPDPYNALVNTNHVEITVADNDLDVGIAGLIADAINSGDFGGDANLEAIVVPAGGPGGRGVRVSIIGDATVTIALESPDSLFMEGDVGEAPILQALDGSQIQDGQTFSLETNSSGGNDTVFEFDSGWAMQVTDVDGDGLVDINDGQSFRFVNTATSATVAVFEFDNALAPGRTIAGSTLIDYTDDMTPEELGDAIATQLSVSGLTFNFDPDLFPAPTGAEFPPAHVGGGSVWMGLISQAGAEVSVTSLTPGFQVVGQPNDVPVDHVPVPFIPGGVFTSNEVAQAMQAAIDQASEKATYELDPLLDLIEGNVISFFGVDPDFIPQDALGDPLQFVMNDLMVPGTPGGGIPVPFTSGDPANNIDPDPLDTVAGRLANAINNNAANVRARAVAFSGMIELAPLTGSLSVETFLPVGDDRLVVNGSSIQYDQLDSPIQQVNVFLQIPVEETYFDQLGNDLTAETIGTLVAAEVSTHPLFTSGARYQRINFLGAQTGDFAGVPLWVDDFLGSPQEGGVAIGHVTVGILASDTASDVAQKLATAINGALQPRITAVARNEFIRLSRGRASADFPITTQGEGPGGTITGLVKVGAGSGSSGQDLYAVSSEGGLYRVNFQWSTPVDPNNSWIDNAQFDEILDRDTPRPVPVWTTYIRSSADDLEGIRFVGVDNGPTTEGGRYNSLMFAMDTGGRLYAFDENGELQPVFVDGQSSLQTELPFTPDGLAFSTGHGNRWHITTEVPPPPDRQLDDTHQLPFSPTGATNTFYGGGSYHFHGLEVPGGTYGTIVSNEFSLVGYAPSDSPSLYVSYFLDKDDVSDFFRVYISDNGGDWALLAEPADTGGLWGQVRVGLAGYAGLDNLRLRFDMTTAGEMNLGDSFTVGEEFRAISGAELLDGQTFQIVDMINNGIGALPSVPLDPATGLVDAMTFEVELGYTVGTPSGGVIPERETISVEGPTGQIVTYEFMGEGNAALAGGGYFVNDGTAIADTDTIVVAVAGTDALTMEFDSGYNLVVPVAGGAGIVDGDWFSVTDMGGVDHLFELDGDGAVNDWLTFPDGGSIADGSAFSVSDGLHPEVWFEFQLNPAPVDPDIPGAVIIAYDAGDDADTIAALVAAQISLNMAPYVSARVLPGSMPGTVQLQGENVTYDLVTEPGHGITTTTAIGIPYSQTSSTQNDVANLIAQALIADGVGAINLENGVVNLRDPVPVFDPMTAEQLFPLDTVTAVDTAGSFGVSDVGAAGVVSTDPPTVVAIPFFLSDASSGADMAEAIADAINANLGPDVTAETSGRILIVTGNATFADPAGLLTLQGNIPIEITGRETAAEVADMVFNTMAATLPPAVTPVRVPLIELEGPDGTTHAPNDPNMVRPTLTNLINLDGAVLVTQTASPLLGLPVVQVTGSTGVLDGNIPVPLTADMTRIEVANVIDGILEALLTEQILLTENGAQYADGEWFKLDIGTGSATYEFESGYVVEMPTQGADSARNGVADGDSLELADGVNTLVLEFETDGIANDVIVVSDAAQVADMNFFLITDTLTGLVYTFEFDEDLGGGGGGTMIPDSYPVVYPTDATESQIATAISDAINLANFVDGIGVSATQSLTAAGRIGDRVHLHSLEVAVDVTGATPALDQVVIDRLNENPVMVIPDTQSLFDGNTFTISLPPGVGNVRNFLFEFEDMTLNDGTNLPGSIPVQFERIETDPHPVRPTTIADTAAEIAQAIAAAINNDVELSPYVDAAVGPLLRPDGSVVPPAERTKVFLTGDAGPIDLNIDPAFTPGIRLENPIGGTIPGLEVQMVELSLANTALGVGRELANAVEASLSAVPLGIVNPQGEPEVVLIVLDDNPNTPTVGDSVTYAQLRGNVGVELIIDSTATGFVAAGTPGVQPNHIAVPFTPGTAFAAADVAGSLTAAINASGLLTATQLVDGTVPARRIQLTGGVASLVNPNTVAVTMVTPNDIVKQDEDLIRIIEYAVIDPGPFGHDSYLPPDKSPNRSPETWEFYSLPAPDFGRWVPWAPGGYPTVRWVPGKGDPPARGLDNAHEGVFIDDIVIGFAERGELVLGSNPVPTFTPPPPPPPPDGPTIPIENGGYQFEIRDAAQYMVRGAIVPLVRTFDTNERLADGVQLEIPNGFDIVDRQQFILGDGLNEVTFTYRDVTAATIGAGHETVADPFRTNITGGGVDIFRGVGVIGDNPAILPPANEVDLLRIDLQAGDIVTVDTDIDTQLSTLDPYLRLFYDDPISGQVRQVANNDQAPAPNEVVTEEAYLAYRAPVTGTYFVGVSSSANLGYDPEVAGSALPGSQGTTVGQYQVEIKVGGGGDSDATIVPFEATEADWEVATRIRDAINSPEVQEILDIRAGTWDGATLIQESSNAGRVNLFGDFVHVGHVYTELLDERLSLADVNDTLDTAVPTPLVAGIPAEYYALGDIGDNPILAEKHELDVDMVSLTMLAGEPLEINVDAGDSPLIPLVSVFDENGTALGWGVGTFSVPMTLHLQIWLLLNPPPLGLGTVNFVAPADGTYYVAVSALDNGPEGFSPPFVGYDPNVAGSGDFTEFISSGTYTLHMIHGNGAIPVDIYEELGDLNRFRDQGQLILHGNRIMDSQEFGIRVEAGEREDGIPHTGPVRLTAEINVDNILPGVTITNNIIAFSGDGGILFNGDPNAGLDSTASVPYGRVINNTLYGQGGDTNDSTRDIIIGAPAGNQIFEDPTTSVGQTFTITDDTGATATFEFTTDAVFDPNNVPVFFTPTDPADVVATAIANAIINSGLGVTVVGQAGPNLLLQGVDTVTGLPFILLALDAGIVIQNNAAPTLINNIVASFDIGVFIDATSTDTVMGGMLFKDDIDNVQAALVTGDPEGEFAIDLDDYANNKLFVDPANRNFYLDVGSLAIDSAVDSIQDRFEFNTVKAPVGISESPVLAPARDQAGLLREDDPNVDSTGGVGANVFKDRGALDRVDFVGPVALLIEPEDYFNEFGAPNPNPIADQDPDRDEVDIVGVPVPTFVIQLADKTDAVDGIGIDDLTVTSDVITITHDGVELVEGFDYRFEYNETNDTITLIPNAGLWEPGEYVITVANQADLFVQAPPGADITDGETFVITDKFNNQVIFEFNDPNGPTPDLENPDDHVELVYDPTWTAAELAQAIADAITAAVAADLLVDINPVVNGDTINIGDPELVSASSIAGLDPFTVGITNLANNPLKPNQDDGQTQFFINITSERDFGDAPDGPGFPVSYPTLEDNDGAFHSVVNSFHLGGDVDFEFEAQTNADATGDDLEGDDEDAIIRDRVITAPAGADLVEGDLFTMAGATGDPVIYEFSTDTFVTDDNFPVFFDSTDDAATVAASMAQAIIDSGLPVEVFIGTGERFKVRGLLSASGVEQTTIGLNNGVELPFAFYPTIDIPIAIDATVPPFITDPAYVDGWIDFNQNGDWTDPGEHILHGTVTTGINTFIVTAPPDALFGNTFARFRLSTDNLMGPTGGGGAGEVEDYKVFVGAANPWHNPRLPEDVNATGRVTTSDLIILGSFLYNYAPPESVPPIPPGNPDQDPPFPLNGPAPFYDVNADDQVNLEDILAVHRYILNPPPAPASDEGPDDGGRALLVPTEDWTETLVPADSTPADQPAVNPSTIVAVGALIDSPANTLFSEDAPAADTGAGQPAPQTDISLIVDEVFSGQAQTGANPSSASPKAQPNLVFRGAHPGIMALLAGEESDEHELRLDKLAREIHGDAAVLPADVLGDLLGDVLDE